jgi:hypothetical protein
MRLRITYRYLTIRGLKYEATDKKVDTGVSTVSFTYSFPLYGRYVPSYLPIQPFFGPHAV